MIKKVRNSNFELLRIVAMVVIILYHFLIHIVMRNNPTADYILKPTITVLHVGVICFVLISGYWGIRFSLKGLINLLVQCIFYSILIYGAAVLLKVQEFSLSAFLESFIPFQWWYIQIYLCLFLLAPLAKKILENSSKEAKTLHIALLTLVSCIIGFLIPGLDNGRNPINFILIYFIGHYIKNHLELNWSTRKIAWMYALNVAGIFTILLALNPWPEWRDFVFKKLFFEYNSIGLIFNSALLFILFSRFNFQSNWINKISGSVLAAYLIHENIYLSKYMYAFIGNLQFEIGNNYLYAVTLILMAVVVFALCILIDKVFKPIQNFIIDRLSNSSKIMKLDQRLKELNA